MCRKLQIVCILFLSIFACSEEVALRNGDGFILLGASLPENPSESEEAPWKAIVLLSKKEDLITDRAFLENADGLILSGVSLPGKPSELERQLRALDFEKLVPDHKNFHKNLCPDFSVQQSAERDGNLHQVVKREREAGQEKMGQIHENFCGRVLNVAAIEQIKWTIERFYVQHNRPFVVVTAPSQSLTNRVLQILVQESVVDQICIGGNQWTSSRRLDRYIGLKSGDAIAQKTLLKNLNFMNRNPFRKVDLVYGPGERENTTDLYFYVDERERPYRFYGGTDNTGVRSTERGRSFIGVNWGEAFQLDHVLSLQYTVSYDPERFWALTSQYLALLSPGHLLNIYGGYSKVKADLPFPNMKNHGRSAQGSFRYIIPFAPSPFWNRELNFGFDLKSLNNTVEFVEFFPRISKLVNLWQFVLGCALDHETSTSKVLWKGDIFYSPGAWLPHQSDDAFSSLRPGAKNHWVYATALLNYLKQTPRSWFFSFVARGQWASENLLPSEQMGIGGYDTVRGYDERELNFDTGIILNAELRTPRMPLIRRVKTHKIDDSLQFLIFTDFGAGVNHNAIPTLDKSDFLAGVGPGLRYAWESSFIVRFDWGFKLHHEDFFTGGNNMIHFSVIGSY